MGQNAKSETGRDRLPVLCVGHADGEGVPAWLFCKIAVGAVDGVGASDIIPTVLLVDRIPLRLRAVIRYMILISASLVMPTTIRNNLQ